jgi:hypothetical protein
MMHLRSSDADLSHFKSNAVSVPLGSCSAFALMAGTAASFNGVMSTIATGSLGVSPGNTITGSYTVLAGSVEIITTSANACALDRMTAYEAAAAATCPVGNTRGDLTGMTLAPGVYCSATALTLSASTLTLDAGGNPDAQWIFQAGSSLTTSPTTSIILANGAQAKNVYWAVGSSAALGYSSNFVGTIMAYASVSLDHNVVMVGRGLAGAAVSSAGTSTVRLPV